MQVPFSISTILIPALPRSYRSAAIANASSGVWHSRLLQPLLCARGISTMCCVFSDSLITCFLQLVAAVICCSDYIVRQTATNVNVYLLDPHPPKRQLGVPYPYTY